MVLLTEQIIKGKCRLDKLEEVRNLNLWGQDLDDVSILSRLPNLEVLSLSVNKINSLREFRNCTKLTELYLRKNEVVDVNEIQHLAALKELKVLWLSDNPCAEHPLYKSMVARVLPHLHKLDNDDMASIERELAQRGASPPQQPPMPPMPQASSSPFSEARASSRGSPGGGYMEPSPAAYPHSSPPTRQRDTAGGTGRSTKNILYAVMALLGELDDDDLVYVRREIEQRLGR